MRTIIFGGLYWGTPILGNYQIYFGFLEGSVGCLLRQQSRLASRLQAAVGLGMSHSDRGDTLE